MTPRRLGSLPPRIAQADTRRLQPMPANPVDPELNTANYKYWRAEVLRRAGYRCEAVDNGLRCPRAAPRARLYADHIVERRDGGALFDPANGQALCGSHHVAKTARARAGRR
jgi:5-methylcytosine-specific restriction enzyme A